MKQSTLIHVIVALNDISLRSAEDMMSSANFGCAWNPAYGCWLVMETI